MNETQPSCLNPEEVEAIRGSYANGTIAVTLTQNLHSAIHVAGGVLNQSNSTSIRNTLIHHSQLRVLHPEKVTDHLSAIKHIIFVEAADDKLKRPSLIDVVLFVPSGLPESLRKTK